MSLSVQGVLLDLEGTLYEAGAPVSGAAEAVEKLLSLGVPHCFVTNTTSRPRSAISRELAAMGIPASPERIFTAPLAARDHLLGRGLTRCHLMVAPAVLEDFGGIEHTDDLPQAVVVGDVGEGFSFERMNHVFRLLLEGAEFVTLARNRYYRGPSGLVLDQGPFVAALEIACGREALLTGKPSPRFFAPALSALGVSASEAAMVGDDLAADVGGAMALGMRGILVRTGKFREAELAASPVRPDAILASVAGLPDLLAGNSFYEIRP